MSDLGVYRYEPKALAASYEAFKVNAEDYVNAEIRAASKPNDATATTTKATATQLVVAATQFTAANLPDSDIAGFCERAEEAIAMAVQQSGANLILLPELWNGPYFCQTQQADLLSLADPVFAVGSSDTNEEDGASNNHKYKNQPVHHVLLRRMQKLAAHYQVVLPVSFYERCNNVLYNSVVVFDADGTNLGLYRKSHIPDGPGYQEKFYFSPGNGGGSGSTHAVMAGGVFDSKVLQCRIGVAICWDQWFPETARCMALQGCSVLLYPTAIGSEPQDPTIQSSAHWQRAMQGHGASNMVPIVASNRFGTEILLRSSTGDNNGNDVLEERQRIHFYGKSFITDNVGAIIAECPDNTKETPVVTIAATIDVEKNRRERTAWGLFRDRRPELYKPLLTKDGKLPG
ncbi:hypothetical protein ACA910_009903 [Epithemia clementina (nom. ined.)]